MKIEKSIVRKLRIVDAPGVLDPITVILEDLAPGRGSIMIEYASKSWVSYWSAMGTRTISEFFVQCDDDYLISSLAADLSAFVSDRDALVDGIRYEVCRLRRARDLDAEKARELFDDCVRYPSVDALSHWNGIMTVYGDEWFRRIPERQNPEYAKLRNVVGGVRAALSELAASKAA